MIVRILLLFVAAYLVYRMLGAWRTLKPPPRGGPPIEAARKCPDCGAYVVGARPEPCGRTDCRFR